MEIMDYIAENRGHQPVRRSRLLFRLLKFIFMCAACVACVLPVALKACVCV